MWQFGKKNEFNISSTAHISSPGSVILDAPARRRTLYTARMRIYIFVFWPVASG